MEKKKVPHSFVKGHCPSSLPHNYPARQPFTSPSPQQDKSLVSRQLRIPVNGYADTDASAKLEKTLCFVPVALSDDSESAPPAEPDLGF